MKNKTLNTIFKLLSATSIAQLIMIISSPVITRIFSPEDMGFYQLFISIVAILTTIASFQYERGIILPKSEVIAINLLILCLSLAFFMSVISYVIAFILIDTSNEYYFLYTLMVPLTVFFMSAFNILNFWCTRQSMYNVIAISRILKSFSTVVIQISFGIIFISSATYLITGYLFGHIFAVIILLLTFLPYRKIWTHVNFVRIKRVFLLYKNFLKYSTPASLFNNFSQQIPIFMLSFFFGANSVGFYSLGQRVLTLPISIFGQAVSQVLYQKCSSLNNSRKPISSIVENAYRYLLAIIFGPIVVIIILGEKLFIYIFGSNWGEAGIYSQILAPWLLLVFIASPMSLLFNIFGKQKFIFKFETGLLIGRFLSILIGGIIGNVYFTIGLFSLTSSIFFIIQLLKILSISKVSKKQCLKILIKYSLISLILLLLIPISSLGSSLVIWISIALLLLLYYILIILSDSYLRLRLLSMIGR